MAIETKRCGIAQGFGATRSFGRREDGQTNGQKGSYFNVMTFDSKNLQSFTVYTSFSSSQWGFSGPMKQTVEIESGQLARDRPVGYVQGQPNS